MGSVVVATLCDGEEGEPLRAPGAELPLALTPRTRGFPLRDLHLSKNPTPMRLGYRGGGNVCPRYFGFSKSEGQGEPNPGFGRGTWGI